MAFHYHHHKYSSFFYLHILNTIFSTTSLLVLFLLPIRWSFFIVLHNNTTYSPNSPNPRYRIVIADASSEQGNQTLNSIQRSMFLYLGSQMSKTPRPFPRYILLLFFSLFSFCMSQERETPHHAFLDLPKYRYRRDFFGSFCLGSKSQERKTFKESQPWNARRVLEKKDGRKKWMGRMSRI